MSNPRFGLGHDPRNSRPTQPGVSREGIPGRGSTPGVTSTRNDTARKAVDTVTGGDIESDTLRHCARLISRGEIGVPTFPRVRQQIQQNPIPYMKISLEGFSAFLELESISGGAHVDGNTERVILEQLISLLILRKDYPQTFAFNVGKRCQGIIQQISAELSVLSFGGVPLSHINEANIGRVTHLLRQQSTQEGTDSAMMNGDLIKSLTQAGIDLKGLVPSQAGLIEEAYARNTFRLQSIIHHCRSISMILGLSELTEQFNASAKVLDELTQKSPASSI